MSEFVENNEKVEELTMEDALDSIEEIKVGDIVTADVLAYDDEQVRVAIHNSGGLEGVVNRRELTSQPFEDFSEVVNIGDEIELLVLKSTQDKEHGNFILSRRRLETRKIWNEIQEKAEKGETIEAPVTDVVKGGLVVDAGVRAFVPASMVEDYYVEDFSPYKGQTLEFKIVEVEPADSRLILSHKEISAAKRKEARLNRLDELEAEVGNVVEGTVARLTNFGAFINLGAVDGLVHISRIAHEHVNKPSDFLSVGEEVKVKVLSVDKDSERVSLSIKDTSPKPWDEVAEKMPEGSVVKGTVKRIVDFGAFIEVLPGVEGLLHISQISYDHIDTPHDRLTEGQEIEVKVLSVEEDKERLSLSMKALEERPEGFSEEASEQKPAKRQRRKRKSQSRAQQAPKTQATEEVEGGFSLGDLLGDQLQDLDLGE